MRVALVHDWLTGLRGGEKCLQAFLKLYPTADIYTLVHCQGTTDPLIDQRVAKTSLLQKFPHVGKYYRLLLPLYPLAAKSLKLDNYDLVISLSHAAVKNVRVPDSTVHICYCFTPMRYVWDQSRHYFGKLTPALYPLIQSLRAWDVRGAEKVDGFVAISSFVAARIRHFYKRKSAIIYPPVDTSWITPRTGQEPGKAYLYAGALVPYKFPELAIKACKKLGRPLWVVGKGPMYRRLKSYEDDQIKLLGALPNEHLAWHYRNSRALIFPGKEDFGMIPVECMAAGRPVIGLAAGGLKDSVNGVLAVGSQEGSVPTNATGVFYTHRSEDRVSDLVEALSFFEQVEDEILSSSCTQQAELFSPRMFYRKWNEYISDFGFPTVNLDVYEKANKAVGQ